ncbi:MAG: Histidine biosynthesis bifunctional protein HisB [Anaerolineales bacterium]|nr:Histidine biosynthesis bifunctional protein HisB [Anaerolineales bacterium]
MKCLQSPGVFHHHNEPLLTPAPAVFLDRDGVLVEETGYLHTIENAILIPGAAHAVRRLNLHHIPAIIVTNQAGIARGYYAWKDFHTVQTHIEQEFQRHGARFDGLWACAHHPNGAGPLASDHPFRKPNPGMILDAGTKLNLDLSRSWLIGDKTIDIQAARNASLAGAILVRTGYGKSMEDEVRALTASAPTAIHLCETLTDAVTVILHHLGYNE